MGDDAKKPRKSLLGNRRKPTDKPQQTVIGLRSSQLEFSKIIVRRGLLIFLIHLILTMAIIFFRVESAMFTVSLMNTAIPLYVVIFGGYFGKAGIENYQKIKNDIALQELEYAASCPQDEPLPDDGQDG